MNARIASLLKDRISEFTYVDKLAGLVRAVTYERAGESITIPVDIGVNDPLACGDAEISDLVPNEGYGCIVYFEDKGMRRVQSRTRGIEFESRMRLVCWVNTAKFNGDNTAGDRIMQQFLGVLQASSHNTGPFIGVRHSVEGMPERGKTLFAAYTYPEGSRQYLMWPFDAFAIDVVTTFRIKPGCEDEVTQGDEQCWTPPANRRRRNPSEFSCDELNAPVTGLTDTQKECIDGCGGGGTCDLCTEIAKESSTAQAIVDCIEDADKTEAVQALLCEAGPCDPLTATLNGVEIINEAEPCGKELALECDDLVDALWVSGAGTEAANGLYRPDGQYNGRAKGMNANGVQLFSGNPSPFPTSWIIGVIGGDNLYTATDSEAATPWDTAYSAVLGSEPAPSVRQATIADLCPCEAPVCEDVTIQLRDTDGNNIGAPDVYPAGTITTKTAPDGSVQLKNSAAGNIGSPVAVRSNQTNVPVTAPDATVQLRDSAANNIGSPVAYLSNSSNNLTAPDGTVTRDGLPFGSVLSGGSLDVPSNCPAAPANILREYATGDTWIKPARLRELLVLCIGAGGGGGVDGPTHHLPLREAVQVAGGGRLCG